jgi:chemotaxis protein CheC
MDVRSLDASQLDAVREVANIGAGHAATALSQLTGHVIMINVPEVRLVRLEEVDRILGEPDEVVAAIMIGGEVPPFPDGFGDLQRSMLREVGNILVGAYLNALSEFMGMLIVMSVPEIAIDMAGAVLATSYLNFGGDREYVLCINTEMTLDAEHVRGHFLLIPDDASLQVILREMKLA